MQPFVAVARELRRYGHRVRLATHAVYREFVEGNGVEFFPLSGAPSILAETVVRNRGILHGGGSKDLMQEIHEQVLRSMLPQYRYFAPRARAHSDHKAGSVGMLASYSCGGEVDDIVT